MRYINTMVRWCEIISIYGGRDVEGDLWRLIKLINEKKLNDLNLIKTMYYTMLNGEERCI